MLASPFPFVPSQAKQESQPLPKEEARQCRGISAGGRAVEGVGLEVFDRLLNHSVELLGLLLGHLGTLGQDLAPRLALVSVEALGVPQLGALKGLRAVEVTLLDLDLDRHLGRTAARAELFQQRRIVHNAGPAVGRAWSTLRPE